MCEISPDLFETELLYSQDVKFPSRRKKKKAYVLVGSLGCSKCKENTSAGLPLFYLFATSCSNMFDFRRDSYWTIVCWDLFVLDFSCFLLGYSSLAPLMGWL